MKLLPWILANNWAPAIWALCRFGGNLGPALFGSQFAVFWQIGPRQIGPQQIGPRQIGPLENLGPGKLGPAKLGPWKIRVRQIGALANGSPANWAPVFHTFVLDIYCQQLGNVCYLILYIGNGNILPTIENISQLNLFIGFVYVLPTIRGCMSIRGCQLSVHSLEYRYV